MKGYSIATLSISNNELINMYSIAISQYKGFVWNDLLYIFKVAMEDRSLFPGVRGAKYPQDYMNKWVKGYVDAMTNMPSARTASPKGPCSDPAIRTIVQHSQGCSEEAAINGELMHNLFMSAENAQGLLLEEFIARNIRSYGFLWCAGNVLHAIDFCNEDGSFLLQIKNKDNTENSSSSTIREGTTIEKWNRLRTRTLNGKKYPDYNWDDLNRLINHYKTSGDDLPPCNLSEKKYIQFLESVTRANKGIISKD